jgi:hypothetical protein
MCLPYLVFGSVIWAAYHQFGEQSLLDQAPLVVADQTPLKLNPDPDLRDRAAAERLGPPEHRLLSAGRQIPTELPGESARAALAALQFRLGASDGGATAPLGRDSIAVMPAAAPAEVAEPAPGSMPPKPSFKPLEVLQAASAELAPPDERSVAARLDLRRAPPPRPALKPAVSLPQEQPEWRPDPDAAPGTRAVAATDQSLPEALRAWWANLKILLASGPASSVMRVGGDDSDRQAPGGGIGAAVADAGDGRSDRSGGGASDRGGSPDAGAGGGGSAEGGTSGGGGGSGRGSDGGNTNSGSTNNGNGRAGDGGSSRGGIGGFAGDLGRGIGDSIGGIADGIGRGGSTSRGDRDDRGDQGGRGRDGDRGDRGGDGGRGDRGDD